MSSRQGSGELLLEGHVLGGQIGLLFREAAEALRHLRRMPVACHGLIGTNKVMSLHRSHRSAAGWLANGHRLVNVEMPFGLHIGIPG